ncbi:MAG: hypothetical protein LBF62_14665 [Tannerellaceae bacterium]|nr:hypothetical protein [Tannerellaceae bacterium]
MKNNIHLQGGTVNGGFHIASGMERLFGKDHVNGLFLTINYQRLSRTDEVVYMILEEQNAFVGMGYRRYFPVSDKVSPYIGANVLAGYQYTGYSENGIFAHHPSKDFLYGAGAHAGMEYKLSPFSLFMEGAWLYEFDHTWQVSAGVKYYF